MTIGRKFGQHEPLTRRLHNLVRSYPKGLGVLKEFIQNADDAEADEILFVIDEQYHDVAGLPESMQWLHKTPALLVYNNKPFTDSDIEGIQNIGESGKSSSVGKTGRFGLGFNACYNVTDVPSFLTRGELHFFDPHFQTVPEASVESPGRCFGVDELIAVGWPLLDGFSHVIGDGDEFAGTVFRLPFRTTQQATTSRIKRDTYTVTDALDAVRELGKMGSAMLLFLKHVRRVRIEQRKQDGSLLTLLSMQATNPDEIASSRSKVNDLLKSPDPESILTRLREGGAVFSSCRHEYSVEADGVKHTESWRVIDGFFTDAKRRVIDACWKMIENGEKALPYAGAAWRLDSHRPPDGRLFCFLPVPMQTDLPAQINGYFDLDDSRQNMFLDQSAYGTARLRVEWNKSLLETSVSQAYVSLLDELRGDLGVENVDLYYRAFPRAVDSETSWERWLTTSFYAHASQAPLFRCSGSSRWCDLSATRSLPDALLEVGSVLVIEGFLPIPDPALPAHIRQGFELNQIDVPELSPRDLRMQLQEQRDVDCPVADAPRACLRKRDHVKQILRFCLSDGSEDGILGLPLVVDYRGHLRTVGLTDDLLYISGMSWDLDIFCDHPEWFVDPDFAREVEIVASEEARLLEMNAERFVNRLGEYVFAQVADGPPRLNSGRVGALTDTWLRSVFNRLLESNLDGLRSAITEIPLIPDQSGTLHRMGSSSTPLLFRGGQDFKDALKHLSVPLVSGVSEKLLKLLEQFSTKQDCIWPVTPRDLVDTLSDHCSHVLLRYETLTDMHRALLGYLSRDESLSSLAEMSDRQAKLKGLKLFPTTKGGLVDLGEKAYVSRDFTFPAVDFNVVLLDDGPSHLWRRLYILLETPELSRSRLIREVLLPEFEALDEDARIKALAWLRDNLSVAQSEDDNNDSEGLFDEVRAASIIVCQDERLRPPSKVYQPHSRLASAVFGDQAAFPDMDGAYAHEPERWLEFFRQLDMPVEPLLADVVEYVRTEIADEAGEDKVERLQAVYVFLKGRVDTEIQTRKAVSDELAAALAALAEMPWIPLRQEPGDFLCFKQPEENYARPAHVYFPRVGQLLASQACITVLRPEPDKRARKAMGFPVSTPIELVAAHFQEVLDACSNPETMPKEGVPIPALGQIYRFFGVETQRDPNEIDETVDDQPISSPVDLKTIFSEKPCIWDLERKCFWPPNHVFKENVRYMDPWRRTIRNADESIECGYAALGRKQEPSIVDWKQVLKEIRDSHLLPRDDEVAGVIREVIRHIVQELEIMDEVDGEVLIPTRDDQMLEAATVFLSDAPWYEPMLDSSGIPILSPSVAGVRRIQRCLNIRSLAGSIEQRPTECPAESEQEDVCIECERLEDLLRSNELIRALQRLLRHEGHEVSEESLVYLRDVRVHCVKIIRTCLYLLEDGSERLLGEYNADIYWEPETPQAMLAEHRRRYFCDDLAGLLNRALGDKSLQNLAPLVHVLRCEPHEISEVLDELKVRQYSFDREERPEAEDTVMPQTFPDDPVAGDEGQETVEPDEAEPCTPGDHDHDEETREEDSSARGKSLADGEQGEPVRGGSTATRRRRDETGRQGQEPRVGRPEGGRKGSSPRNHRETRPGSVGAKTDMEIVEASDGEDSAPPQSKASEPPATAQSRLVSYVLQRRSDAAKERPSAGVHNRRLRVGEAAVKIVVEHEQKKGRNARAMAHPNAGYDVISEGNDKTRYIEVKGTEAAWGERGVAMTPTQFFYAREHPDRDHWLYVVEDVFSQTPTIHEIQNPSDKVDRFVFDGGWRQAAESAQGRAVEMSLPASGDEVLVDGQVVGVVQSVLASGRFPLVIYIDAEGKKHRKLLAELIIRSKEA